VEARVRFAIVLVLAGCSSAIREAPPGYPHPLDPPDPARRRADADRAIADGWTVAPDGEPNVTKVGAAWGEEPRLGPLTERSLASLRAWIVDHPVLFDLAPTRDHVFETTTEHPHGLRGSLCQRSGGRIAACIFIAWHGPFYSDGSYTPERIIISGRHYASLPALPAEIDDRRLAGAAFDAEAPWVWGEPLVAKDFRQIEARSEHRSPRGTRIQHISIHRAPRRAKIGGRWFLRMVATVSSRISGAEHTFDAVTGERLRPKDLR
jgi:hypothetical protein